MRKEEEWVRYRAGEPLRVPAAVGWEDSNAPESAAASAESAVCDGNTGLHVGSIPALSQLHLLSSGSVLKRFPGATRGALMDSTLGN